MEKIEDLRKRLAVAVVSKYSFLDTSETWLYRKAEKEIRRVVDYMIRPVSNPEGVKSLDAWRFYHDRSFAPESWMQAGMVPMDFLRQLEENPDDFSHPDDWGRSRNWASWDTHSCFTPFITHYWRYSPRQVVWEFLKHTEEEYPDLYARVLEKVVETFEYAAKNP